MSSTLPQKGSTKITDQSASRVQFSANSSRPLQKFAVVGSNCEAIQGALLFSKYQTPFVALVGPTGWGKTHLLEAVAEEFRPLHRKPIQVQSATTWVEQSSSRENCLPVILDDVQACLQSQRHRQQLRSRLERRVRLGRPTLLSITTDRRQSRFEHMLPIEKAWNVYTLPEPRSDEWVTILNRLLENEGLEFSERLKSVMARRLGGNGRTMHGALQRLKLVSAHWLSEEDEMRALGYLRPFLKRYPNSGMRERIDRVIREVLNADQDPSMTEFSRCVAIYAMRHFFELDESSIAEFYGVSPGDVYTSYSTICKAIQVDDSMRRLRDLSFAALSESLDSL